MAENGLKRRERATGRGYQGRNLKVTFRDKDAIQDIPTPEASQDMWAPKRQPQVRRKAAPEPILGMTAIPPGLTVETTDGGLDLSFYANVDACLQVIFSRYKLHSSFSTYLKSVKLDQTTPVARQLLNVFDLLDQKDFFGAKKFVIEKIMGRDIHDLDLVDYLESESRFVKAIAKIFPVMVKTNCKSSCIKYPPRVSYPMREFVVRDVLAIPILLKRNQFNAKCSYCGSTNVNTEYSWGNTGVLPMIGYFVDIAVAEIECTALPSTIGVVGQKFGLCAYTYTINNSFEAVLFYKQKRYLYDSNGLRLQTQPCAAGHKVSTVWYAPM